MKDYIKALVKESLGGILKEKSKTPAKSEKKTEKDKKNLDDKDQVSMQNNADSIKAPPKSHIMKLAGLGDPNNASDRSKFNKKLGQEDGQGFDDKDAAKVSKVISNLNV